MLTKIKNIAITFLLVICIHTIAFADNYDSVLGHTLNVGSVCKYEANEIGLSLDYNYTNWFYNGNLGYKYFSESELHQPYISIGLGVFSFFQVQIGYSYEAEVIYRIQSIPIIPTGSFPAHSSVFFRSGLSVLVFYEGSFSLPNQNTFGLAIGIVF